MAAQGSKRSIPVRFVEAIPDLMTWDDYQREPEPKKIRFRLIVSANGIEILGDSPYPQILEHILEGLEPEEIESLLCG